MSSDWLRVFEGKALAEELTKSGHSISEKTAQRWKNGETKPKPQDIRAIRELVGAQQSTPPGIPSGAADELLRLWTGRKAPPWAQSLANPILNAIERNRVAFLEQSAAQYAALAKQLLEQDNDDEEPPAKRGRRPKQPGPTTGP